MRRRVAAQNLDAGEVLKLLDYPAYFDLTDQPLPEGREAILAALAADQMIERNDSGHWSVTNLGAILFAKRLQDFQALGRKAFPEDPFHRGIMPAISLATHALLHAVTPKPLPAAEMTRFLKSRKALDLLKSTLQVS